jgi:hypothetical protein
VVIAKETLKNRVDRLLASPMITSPLRAQGIQVVDVSSPRQTETTQLWKAGLRAVGLSIDLRMKIEFSRRDHLDGVAFEAIGPELLRTDALTPSWPRTIRCRRRSPRRSDKLLPTAQLEASRQCCESNTPSLGGGPRP